MKNCLYCNKEFAPKRKTGKYCSVSCRVAYNHAKPLIASLVARIAELEAALEKEREYSLALEQELKAAPVENSEPEYDSEFSFD